MFNPLIQAAPKFLKDTKYQNPSDSLNSPFQRAFQTGELVFTWMHKNPENLGHFVSWMGTAHDMRPPWTNVLPIQQECKTWRSDAPLFVDVGAGIGFESAAFRQAATGIPGRVIAQDLKETLDHSPTHDGVEKMVHDFWTPQPIKGTSIISIVFSRIVWRFY
jgi:demethylsterigmatocystin 6-O-methyltransferase